MKLSSMLPQQMSLFPGPTTTGSVPVGAVHELRSRFFNIVERYDRQQKDEMAMYCAEVNRALDTAAAREAELQNQLDSERDMRLLIYKEIDMLRDELRYKNELCSRLSAALSSAEGAKVAHGQDVPKSKPTYRARVMLLLELGIMPSRIATDFDLFSDPPTFQNLVEPFSSSRRVLGIAHGVRIRQLDPVPTERTLDFVIVEDSQLRLTETMTDTDYSFHVAASEIWLPQFEGLTLSAVHFNFLAQDRAAAEGVPDDTSGQRVADLLTDGRGGQTGIPAPRPDTPFPRIDSSFERVGRSYRDHT